MLCSRHALPYQYERPRAFIMPPPRRAFRFFATMALVPFSSYHRLKLPHDEARVGPRGVTH